MPQSKAPVRWKRKQSRTTLFRTMLALINVSYMDVFEMLWISWMNVIFWLCKFSTIKLFNADYLGSNMKKLQSTACWDLKSPRSLSGRSLRHAHMARACRICPRAHWLLWLRAWLGKWFFRQGPCLFSQQYTSALQDFWKIFSSRNLFGTAGDDIMYHILVLAHIMYLIHYFLMLWLINKQSTFEIMPKYQQHILW